MSNPRYDIAVWTIGRNPRRIYHVETASFEGFYRHIQRHRPDLTVETADGLLSVTITDRRIKTAYQDPTLRTVRVQPTVGSILGAVNDAITDIITCETDRQARVQAAIAETRIAA